MVADLIPVCIIVFDCKDQTETHTTILDLKNNKVLNIVALSKVYDLA